MNREGIISMDRLSQGSGGEVITLLVRGPARRRLLDLGLVPGSIIHVIRRSPMGDPTAYNIRGGIIALRKEEAGQVLVRPVKPGGDSSGPSHRPGGQPECG